MENVLIDDHNIKNCAAAAESKGKCEQVCMSSHMSETQGLDYTVRLLR